MEKKRFNNWWFLAVNGLVCMLFGILLFAFTVEFLHTIIFWFGLLVLLSGGGLILAGIHAIRKDRAAAMIIAEAVAAIAIGLVLVFYPGFSLALFLILVGVWATVIGIVQLTILFSLRAALKGNNILWINALATLLFGVLLFFNPFDWAAFMGKVLGVMAVVIGALMVYISLVIRTTIKAAWTREA